MLDESSEPFFRRRIDPVEILDRQDEGLTLAVVQYDVPQQCKSTCLTLLWAETRQPLAVHRHIEQMEEQGCVSLRTELGVLQIAMDFGRGNLCPVGLDATTPLAQQVTYRHIGCHAAIRKAMPFSVGHRLSSEAAVEFCQ